VAARTASLATSAGELKFFLTIWPLINLLVAKEHVSKLGLEYYEDISSCYFGSDQFTL